MLNLNKGDVVYWEEKELGREVRLNRAVIAKLSGYVAHNLKLSVVWKEGGWVASKKSGERVLIKKETPELKEKYIAQCVEARGGRSIKDFKL